MPAPDDPRKPDGPSDLTKRSWFYVLRKTFHEFTEDQCTDLAAALTYYAVLAVFPAALALVSVLGVIGQADKAVDKVVDTLQPLVSEQMLGTIEPALREIASSDAAGLALVLGVAGGAVVGLRVRRRLRPRDEPDLRDRRGPAVLEAAADHAAADAGRRAAGRGRPAAADRLRTGRRVHRQRHRARGHRPDRLVDREVAGPGGDRRPGRRAALLRDTQRAAAEVPVDLGGRRRGDPDLGARLGRLRVLRRQLLQLQQDLRIAGRRRSSRCCSCGSPTWPYSSVGSWTPSSNAVDSCRQASRPRRRSSSRLGTPATSRRPARSGTRTSRWVDGSAARRPRTAHRTGSKAPRRRKK